jgi:hypothetical protein
MRTEEDRCTDPVAAAVEEEGDRPVLLSYTSVGLPRTDYIFSLVLFFVPEERERERERGPAASDDRLL